ncbi:hypothetical protein [Cupriavidus sp. DF5525]|uniref:hypothetical protein n=1 Tax=Cupriavidus sp. DF5525 TaxID=3160989 RepID=UPI0035A867B9
MGRCVENRCRQRWPNNAPPGLSPDIVKKANGALNTALKDLSVVKSIVDRGDEPGGGTPEQFATLTRTHYKMWGDVVKANNITAD